MAYQKLNGTVCNDFRFVKDGSYTDRNALPRGFRRSGPAPARTGRVCIACGMVRSVTNKCECNS